MRGRSQAGTRNWTFHYLAGAALFLAVCALLFSLALQISQELSRLRAAPTDNVQWSVAQVQVELLTLNEAIDRALADDGASLDNLRQRFDIFYSRIDTLERGSVFAAVMEEPRARQALSEIREALLASIPLIDGPDAALREGLGELQQRFDALQSTARVLSLEGVRVLARQSDLDRQAFSDLLLHTELIALFVFAVMVLALGLLWWQSRVARRRSQELQISNLRFASAISASLDPIIVSDARGHVLDFNPAAERVFGCTRENAQGALVEKLIIPPEARKAHRERMARYLDGDDSQAMRSARIELEMMRADGKRFPAELSVGITRGGHGPIFTTYIRDISDRLRTQAALTAARDEALATAKAKSDFLAVMSHEMRTPLNGVMGLLDVLRDTRLSRRQMDYVTTAITSGEILQRHIDEVLDITRIEAGAVRLRPASFDVATLLREVQNVNAPAAAPRGNRIVLQVHPQIDNFTQDRHSLRQVLMNLVGNAIKFTLNGTITLEAAPYAADDGKDWIEFAVSDTGIGISPEDTRRIFEDFVMLDPSYRRTSPGSGLGLGISQRITAIMGGEIGVESEPEKGSRFWLRVPALLAASTQSAEARPEKTGVPAAGGAFGLTVLVVEDNEINRFVAREMLEKFGCSVTEAEDGEGGVALARETRFDLILMDISMPKLDGLRATQLIRADGGRSQDAPIVGLTAHALPEEQRKLRSAGMQDCIIKPLRSEKIAALLERTVGKGEGAPEFRGAPAGSCKNGQEPCEPVLDLDALGELVDALPQDLLEKQMARFRDELQTAPTQFGDACVEGLELGELQKLAHRYAGSAAVFGALRLRTALLAVENASRNDSRSEAIAGCRAVRLAALETGDAMEQAGY